MSTSPESGPSGEPALEGQVKSDHRKHVRQEADEAKAWIRGRGLFDPANPRWGMPADRLRNLSEGGAAIRIRRQLKPGYRGRLRIELPQCRDVVELDAEVRWCRESPRTAGAYYIGLTFADLAETERNALMRVLKWFDSAEFRSASRRRGSSAGFQAVD